MSDTKFDDKGRIVYKGIKLNITREQIYEVQDLGMDPMYYIEKMYNERIDVIRDKKIDLILKK